MTMTTTRAENASVLIARKRQPAAIHGVVDRRSDGQIRRRAAQTATVLVADDEPRIASLVARGLAAHGFAVRVVADGAAALSAARSGQADLLVIDIDLPRLDGIEVVRRLRAQGVELPTLMLRPRGSATGAVVGMEGQADDYLCTPFRFEELLVKVRRWLSPTGRTPEPTQLTHGDLRLDLSARRAHVGDYCVGLSARECALAATFLRHPGEVLTRQHLLSTVWGHEHAASSNVVDVYVRYLRSKLGARRFVSVRGLGYRLEQPAR